jgi:glycosyltransferase involved in cell wall biosynthesis
MSQKLTILTFVDYYLPGYKAGGPIRTIANLVETLGDEFDFKIVTRDRDFSDDLTYEGVEANSWKRVGKADVFYMNATQFSFADLQEILNNTHYDLFYFNSFFSYQLSIKPILAIMLKLVPYKPIILAPRGEFSAGALVIKSLKKKIFIELAKITKLYNEKILWNASTEYEKEDILNQIPNAKVFVAQDIPSIVSTSSVLSVSRLIKTHGILKIIFLSRISPKKNLHYILEIISNLKGIIELDIFGVIDDEKYWLKCSQIIDKLPKNITVNYHGTCCHSQVNEIMIKHDLFLLPTLGENFGYAILESLVAGCPVLISDRTPWQDLEKKQVGWDISLEKPEKFLEVLQFVMDMDEDEHAVMRNKARIYGKSRSNDRTTIANNVDMFKVALENN